MSTPARPQIVSILSILTEHEATLLRLRFRDKLTWLEVAEAVQATESAVRMAVARAIVRVKAQRNIDLTIEM
jgi:DNA-directed RNA polymerase specialized sigma subunit